MRLFRFTLLAIATLAATLVSCEKPVPVDDTKAPTIEITDDSIEGCWQLTHLNGAVVSDDTQLYIEFSPKEHRYEMWDNIGSMYLRQTTGSYKLVYEEDGTQTLQGTYDNGVGDWNEEYRVVMLKGDRFQWWSRTTSTCLEFKFAMEIPEEFN